ncbi:GDP-L-fucose synthase [Candidatus Saccharibacteria bacterium]|nr:GDP-L-fucose synthase [Candidatus Saccharibacteria bacterium]
MHKNAKIYIAGHNGLVGSAIHRHLVALGYENIICRSHSELDLMNQDATNKFFEDEKPEYVFLAAAKVGGINANNIYRADFILDNLQIQNNVISASYKNKVKKLLFLGSVCIYPKNATFPIVEDSLLTGELEYTNEPYAIAKIAGIKLIESFNLQYGTNYVAVMPTNLYGENDNFDLEKSHVMPALIRKCLLCKNLEDGNLEYIANNLGLKDKSKTSILSELTKYGIEKNGDIVSLGVWGTGKAYREFMHVDDMADACIFVMDNVDFSDLSKNDKEVRNTQINIGTGEDITIKDLVYKIKEVTGFNGEIKFDTSKPDGTYRRPLDVSKLSALGWTSKIDLDSGLAKTIEWYESK